MAIERWSIDTAHSSLYFIVRHLVVTKVRGTFTKWSGTIDLDAEDVSRSHVSAKIDVASIDTREAQRDGHLRSADFFDVEKFPEMTFTSTRVDGENVVGELSLHGVTKEVKLSVESLGKHKDPWGNERMAYSAKGALNRSDFGLKYNQVLEAGGLLVSDKVEIEIEVQALRAKAEAAA